MSMRTRDEALAYNAIYNVIYRLLNVVFPLISATYLSRVLAPSGVGQVAYAQNVVSYFLMFAVLGIPEYGTREVAKVQYERNQLDKLFSELLLINFLSTSIGVIAYYAFVYLLFPTDNKLYLIIGLQLLFNYFNIDWLYQGREAYVYITRRSILVKVLSLVAMFVFVKSEEDYISYALILCLGTGCNYLFNVVHARRSVSLTLRNLHIKRHLPPILTLMVSVVAASLYSKVDITMLGWLDSTTSVGYYTNANKVVGIALTFVTALSAVFLPRLSYVYQNDRARYREYLTLGLKIVLTLAIPSCAGLILIADNLVVVMFGELFVPAALTVKILSIFTIVKGVGDLLCYQAIISSGHEKALVKSRVIAGIANVILNAVLIPKLSHNGAAIASVVSECIVNGMLLPYALSIAAPKVSKHFLKSIIVSALLMITVVIAVQKYFGCSIIALITSILLGVACYFIALIATKNDIAENMLSAMKEIYTKQA